MTLLVFLQQKLFQRTTKMFSNVTLGVVRHAILDNFWPPSPPVITFLVNRLWYCKNPWHPLPYGCDVIYGLPLNNLVHQLITIERYKMLSCFIWKKIKKCRKDCMCNICLFSCLFLSLHLITWHTSYLITSKRNPISNRCRHVKGSIVKLDQRCPIQ